MGSSDRQALGPATKKTWIHRLAKDSSGWKILLAVVFVAILSIFIHFREVKMEVLELGATSKQYIIAQINFEYPDEDSTLVLKEQAMQDIGAIYKFSDKQMEKVMGDFEHQLVQNLSLVN